MNIDSYKVYLSDNKEYCFYSELYLDPASLKYRQVQFKVRTICDCMDEDWKTAVALNKPKIPKGTELIVKGVLTNYYGRFVEISYSRYNYSLNPRLLEYVGAVVNEK